MTKSENDSDGDHGIILALITAFEGLEVERGAKPLTSIILIEVKPNELDHKGDSMVSSPLKARFKKGTQEDYKALPLNDGASKLHWKLYSPMAHRIM
ncbi:hypothetical protein AMTR_s00043p00224140 [Amborella trichopoda]|uniref:Uncharacterized protein n=1 Tax=Amborella trichopoda TaxID=13333 RepID=W1PS10_AMBTC|nr:hypothetical protein AMTR_s00043p00224140 [Amborella trichopoda]